MLQGKYRNISDVAQRVLFMSEARIGGSWIVDPTAANDLDIVVPEWAFTRDNMLDSLTRAGFYMLQAGDAKYDEIDHMRLIHVLERTADEKSDNLKINVIVVGNYYWPAYIGAIQRMQNNSAQYVDRQSRIDLHRGLCKQIAGIIQHDLGY